MNQPTPSPENSNPLVPAGEEAIEYGGLSRRQRLMLLCNYNAEYLQQELEKMLLELPWAASTGILFYLKTHTKGEITRSTLYKLPGYFLSRLDDSTFDYWRAVAMRWLSDL